MPQCSEALRGTAARGYHGSYYSVRRQLVQWRKADLVSGAGGSTRPAAKPSIERPSARRVCWLLLKDHAERDAGEQSFLDRLQQRCPELRDAAGMARQFREMVRARHEGGWEDWLTRATALGIAKELRAFAECLKKDEPAVRAALQLEWSNGQVEGQVNRLKTIKRQMYGRAKFDLLRQRVLKAA